MYALKVTTTVMMAISAIALAGTMPRCDKASTLGVVTYGVLLNIFGIACIWG